MLGGLLVFANVLVWGWAAYTFHGAALLGTAALAYGLGLRHAVDADHIAAIDNVTRKLRQDGQRPALTGLFFSLGHSTVVVLASIGIVLTATAFSAEFDAIREWGGLVGTLVSAGFLLVVACINAAIVRSTWRMLRRRTAPDDGVLAGDGPLTRLVRPLFRLIRRSWHMYPLGFLFGLGFDTASEVGLLGMSAAEGARGLPLWSVMVLPALFTAGMSLVDTADGVFMLQAYEWAFARPQRKLYYNLAITALSVAVALVVGAVELLGLIGERLQPDGAFWRAVAEMNEHLGVLGYGVIALFALVFAGALLATRLRAAPSP